jgi:SAM-dependent methyltransferase
MNKTQRFHGRMGDEYNLIRRVMPHYDRIQSGVGRAVARFRRVRPAVLEIGCGDGSTTFAILDARPDAVVTAIDNEPKMVATARRNLRAAIGAGRCAVRRADALAYVSGLPDGSVDVAASALTLHNFSAAYRRQLLAQLHRVLAPGGLFVNSDKYTPQDDDERFAGLGVAVQRFFDALVPLRKYTLLEEWVLHSVTDQEPDRVMKEKDAVAELKRLGFVRVALRQRENMEALVTARKE